jgi:regulatory protein YycI of two-component signal transduction system YycFG
MKWESAKTWLIMAFLFLDCILGWQVYSQRQAQVAYVESYSDLLANTKTLLSEHGLSLEAPVPQGHDKLAVLKGTFADPSLVQLAGGAFPGIQQVHVDVTAAEAKLALGTIQITDVGTWQVNYTTPLITNLQRPSDILKAVWQGNQYVSDAASSVQPSDKPGLKRYNFTEKYQSYPIFDATVAADVGQAKLWSFTQTAVVDIQTVGGAKPTISALDALDSLANSMDQMMGSQGGSIISVEIGYAHKVAGDSPPDTSAASANYWFPVWRIVTPNTTYFVNAYTGEVNVPSK